MDAPLETALECSLAAATRMDLGLHHEFAVVESGGDGFGLGGGVGDFSGLGGDAELGKKFSGLVFVNVHADKGISAPNYTASLQRESTA